LAVGKSRSAHPPTALRAHSPQTRAHLVPINWAPKGSAEGRAELMPTFINLMANDDSTFGLKKKSTTNRKKKKQKHK